MKSEANNQIEVEPDQLAIPSPAVREYITGMLAELCRVAEQDGQEDLHILLKLTHQAVENAA